MSRLEEEDIHEVGEKAEIDNAFTDAHVLAASQDFIPLFTDCANYLTCDIVPSDLSFH